MPIYLPFKIAYLVVSMFVADGGYVCVKDHSGAMSCAVKGDRLPAAPVVGVPV